MDHGLPPYAFIEEALAVGMREVTTLLRDELQYAAPQATGDFALGLATELIFGAELFEVFLHSTAEVPLLEWVIDGTPPHEIGGYDQFLYNPDEGFAALGPVLHPGTDPNPFVARTLLALENEITDILTTAVASAMMR